MKQGTKRFVSMVLSLVLVVAAFVVFFDLIQPTYSDAQAVRAQEISQQQLVNSQKVAVQQAQSLIQEYQNQQNVQQQVSYVLPLSPDIAGALTQLNGLAAANGIQITAITVNAPSTNNTATAAALAQGSQQNQQMLVKPTASIDFELKFTGSYESFKSFLSELETNLRVFDVKSINLAPAGNQSDSYTFDITVTTYYQTL